MTALEEQLTEALKRLSAQYETEQQRHSGQVEALRGRVERQSAENEALRRRVERLSEENDALGRQIERLSEQVTRLTEYCGTSAAARPHGHGWR
ncbi:MbeD/MobD family mobilization/exclusion protein [Candidatus Palauibacter sp.]|uniref:MbeD/MobD family mobilization/exclusion protein n=1 Tax=Candidatus Palauibacter sp. TaxID=3101350 RepID=UPI003C6F3CC6